MYIYMYNLQEVPIFREVGRGGGGWRERLGKINSN